MLATEIELYTWVWRAAFRALGVGRAPVMGIGTSFTALRTLFAILGPRVPVLLSCTALGAFFAVLSPIVALVTGLTARGAFAARPRVKAQSAFKVHSIPLSLISPDIQQTLIGWRAMSSLWAFIISAMASGFTDWATNYLPRTSE